MANEQRKDNIPWKFFLYTFLNLNKHILTQSWLPQIPWTSAIIISEALKDLCNGSCFSIIYACVSVFLHQLCLCKCVLTFNALSMMWVFFFIQTIRFTKECRCSAGTCKAAFIWLTFGKQFNILCPFYNFQPSKLKKLYYDCMKPVTMLLI